MATITIKSLQREINTIESALENSKIDAAQKEKMRVLKSKLGKDLANLKTTEMVVKEVPKKVESSGIEVPKKEVVKPDKEVDQETIKKEIAILESNLSNSKIDEPTKEKFRKLKSNLEKSLIELKTAEKDVKEIPRKFEKIAIPEHHVAGKKHAIANAAQKRLAEKQVKLAETKANKILRRALPPKVKAFNAHRPEHNIELDAERKALPPGKRISAEGNVYYENRPDESDISTTKKPYLERGGSIGFIPMDLEQDLAVQAKWGEMDIKEVIGILNAMIDAGLTDEDLAIKPTKDTRFQREKAKEKKVKEIWDTIEPHYKGDLKGNRPYGLISHLVDRASNHHNDDILKRFKPFRNYQKDSFKEGGELLSGINWNKFTLNELNKELKGTDISLDSFLPKGIDSYRSLLLKKDGNKLLSVGDAGKFVTFSTGSENMYLDLLVYDEHDDEYIIALHSKENHSGLKEIAENLIKKFKKGGAVDSDRERVIEWLKSEDKKYLERLKEEREKVSKFPDNFVETGGGSGRSKKQILADIDKYIKRYESKKYAKGGLLDSLSPEDLCERATVISGKLITDPELAKKYLIAHEKDMELEGNFIELTKEESKRLDELQKKEDFDSLTKEENKEYEALVEKYRKTKEYGLGIFEKGGSVNNDGYYNVVMKQKGKNYFTERFTVTAKSIEEANEKSKVRTKRQEGFYIESVKPMNDYKTGQIIEHPNGGYKVVILELKKDYERGDAGWTMDNYPILKALVQEVKKDGEIKKTSKKQWINLEYYYAKGGTTDKWIQSAIQHPGRLRRHAEREGLIHGEEKLSLSDLHKLEAEGGHTAKEAHLAETLREFEGGGSIYANGMTKDMWRNLGHTLESGIAGFSGKVKGGTNKAGDIATGEIIFTPKPLFFTKGWSPIGKFVYIRKSDDEEYESTEVPSSIMKIPLDNNEFARGGNIHWSGEDEYRIKKAFEQSKKEILSDVADGTLPKDEIHSFSDLHDYVDANYYGGFIEEGYKASKNYRIENEVQNKVDEWIKSGGLNDTKMAHGGRLDHKVYVNGIYQNEAENDTYSQYNDAKKNKRAKPCGWRYTNEGAARLKVDPRSYVSLDDIKKYRNKYFTDRKGDKHRYIYIERREDKSDKKKNAPYLENGGQLLPFDKRKEYNVGDTVGYPHYKGKYDIGNDTNYNIGKIAKKYKQDRIVVYDIDGVTYVADELIPYKMEDGGVVPKMTSMQMRYYMLDNNLRNGFGKIDYEDAKYLAAGAKEWVLKDVNLDDIDNNFDVNMKYKNKSVGFPPIVLLVNGVYEVVDGKHRISMEKQRGVKSMKMWVGED